MSTTIQIPEYSLTDLYPHTKTLSSSQVLLYAEDPSRFYTEYTLGVRREPTVPMQIGSIFSELHRNRSFPFREALAQVKAPRHVAELFERAIKTFPVVPAEIPLKAKYKGWGFRATLDGYVKTQATIIENKTGKTLWTQDRADNSPQITFQSWVHLKKEKTVPKKILLNWLDTAPRTQRPLVSLVTSRTKDTLEQFEKIIDIVIAGIEAENWTQPLFN